MNIRKPHDNYHHERLIPWYDEFGEESDFSVDDQTFKDLDMDRIHSLFDVTCTAPGSYALYETLRNPGTGEEKRNYEVIEALEKDENLKESIRKNLLICGSEINSDYTMPLKYIRNFHPGFLILFSVVIILFLASLFLLFGNFNQKLGLFLFMGSVFISSSVSYFLDSTLKVSKSDRRSMEGFNLELSSLLALSGIMRAAENISRIDHWVVDDIRRYTDTVRQITSRMKFLESINLADLSRAIADFTFINHIAYFFTARRIKMDTEDVLKVTKELGRMDMLMAMTEVRKAALEQGISVSAAVFKDKERYLDAEELVHPLVENCVPNSISLSGEGVILTGSNMSGKSTFIKTVATNAILAQCFGFVFGKSYTASRFNIMTSISPEDDISGKKSYFLSEAEAVNRIIGSRDKERTGLFIIDEIFRGTNPEERIAASVSIADYLNSGNTLTLISTHDMGIVEKLTSGWRKFYFTEEITDGEILFSYRIREGVARGTNAIKVLELLEYPEEITGRTREIVSELRSESDRLT